MKLVTRKQLAWWNVVALALGLAPIGLFWFLFGRAPSVSVTEAKGLLTRQTDPAALLVDVRPAAVYASNHVAGAVNWPADAITSLADAKAVPASLQGKKLLLICDTGLSSALAVDKLRKLGVSDAFNVSGGMVAWLDFGDGKKSDLPFHAMTPLEQWLAVSIAFGIKPVYMMLSLGLIIWLWRRRAVDLAMLRWGLIWFWIGENGCSIDFLFFKRGSDFWEYVHGYGMAAGFAMVVYAVLEGMDHRLIKFSPAKERCAALSLCRACIKYDPAAPCGLKRLFTIMIPAFMLLALMPLTADFKLTAYNAIIVGTLHNYYHLASSQLFELRYCAGLAFVLFAASWLVLRFKRTEPVAASKVLFAAALGPLSFGMLRMFFVATFSDRLVWFDVWEEFTELLFIVSAGAVLWVFRGALFGKQPAAEGRAGEKVGKWESERIGAAPAHQPTFSPAHPLGPPTREGQAGREAP